MNRHVDIGHPRTSAPFQDGGSGTEKVVNFAPAKIAISRRVSRGLPPRRGSWLDHARARRVTDVDGNLPRYYRRNRRERSWAFPPADRACDEGPSRESFGRFVHEPSARSSFSKRLAKNRPSEKIHRTQLYSSGVPRPSSPRLAPREKRDRPDRVRERSDGGFHGKTMGVLFGRLAGSELQGHLRPVRSGVPIARRIRTRTMFPPG